MSEALPEGWTWAKLGDVTAGIQYGYTASADTNDTGPRFLRITDIQGGKVDWSSVPSCKIASADVPRYQLRPGDIVFARSGATTGKSFLIEACPVEAVFASYLIRVRAAEGALDPRYLSLTFRTSAYWTYISESVAGNAQPNCNGSKLAEFTLPIAPLAEQRRIVAKVEALLAQVNAARERLVKLPLILKRFRQAVLAAACSGTLTEDWREAHPHLEAASCLLDRILEARRERVRLGGPGKPKTGSTTRTAPGDSWDLYTLPTGWCWASWDDLADWITYGFTRPMPHVPTGIPIVTARHISAGLIDFSSVDYTTERAYAELSDKDRPRHGELLLTKDGSIGRAALVNTSRPFCINQSVAVIRFGGMSADPDYLRIAIESPWTQHLIEEGAKGSAIRHIAITTFGKFPVPLPPMLEQQEIVRRVEALLGMVDAIERRYQVAASRADRLPHSILTKAFSGELVPTEADLARTEGRTYEPASALIRRVRANAEHNVEQPLKSRRTRQVAPTKRDSSTRSRKLGRSSMPLHNDGV